MSRRLVSVLFLDLVGWTGLAERLDPEPLQQLLERYYELCVAAVEQYEGAIEKYIGDAIMASFGAERSQEDDALRAVRAAWQIREQVAQLRTAKDSPLRVHCGIAAGEALVTHSPRAGLRVVGDVVNLAARLQSAAPADEIFVNETMVRLVRSRFAMERIPPMTLKGKREPVAAWRVASTVARAAGQWSGAPLVDRHAERGRLREAYHEVSQRRRLRVLTVLGLPGVGKSRLVNETVDELAAGDTGPRTALGTCSSYGGTETYAALSQVLNPLLAGPFPGDAGLSPRVPQVLSYLRVPPATSNRTTAPGIEEISWATRELLRFVASRPLVLVWDDLHWASQSLLGLIGDVADGLRDRPVLMICVARPELREQRPSWLRPEANAITLELKQLSHTDTTELVASIAAAQATTTDVVAHDAELLERVSTESAGNPLFAELMLETVASGHQLDQAPPSVTAMTGASIDRLPAAARDLIEAASVVGRTFTLDQAAHLCSAPPADGIADLLDRQLLRAGSKPDEYQFVRQMVHGVVYARLSKRQRMASHQKLAQQGVDPAFHLESAVRLLLDLQPDAPELRELGQAAAEALLREGTDALRRRDLPAAIGLLGRARDISRHGNVESQVVAAVRLSDALLLSSQLSQALAVVEVAADDDSQQAGDAVPYPPAGPLRTIQRHLLTLRATSSGQVPLAQLEEELRQLAPDPLAWCRFHQLQMLQHVADGQFHHAEMAVSQALDHARGLADTYEEDRLLTARCEIGQWSPSPIAAKLAACQQLAERFAGDRYLLVPILAAQARFLALTGDLDSARAVLTEAKTAADELRLTIGSVLVAQVAALTHSLAGARQDAEEQYRQAVATLEVAGHRPAALTMRALAARERLGVRPAPEVAAELHELAGHLDQMDVRGRALCLASQARVAAATGGEVTGPAEQAVLAASATDDACLRGDVHFDLARAYRDGGDLDRARAAAELAIAIYTTVGATSPIRKVSEWI